MIAKCEALGKKIYEYTPFLFLLLASPSRCITLFSHLQYPWKHSFLNKFIDFVCSSFVCSLHYYASISCSLCFWMAVLCLGVVVVSLFHSTAPTVPHPLHRQKITISYHTFRLSKRAFFSFFFFLFMHIVQSYGSYWTLHRFVIHFGRHLDVLVSLQLVRMCACLYARFFPFCSIRFVFGWEKRRSTHVASEKEESLNANNNKLSVTYSRT